MRSLMEQLARGESLLMSQVSHAVRLLVDHAIDPVIKADFLAALAQKGETVDEIAALVRELRERSVCPPLDESVRSGEILDVCGTGGDRLNTFNISTTVALVCSAAGVVVAKHGNRAITSKSGSADVLEALGIPVDLQPDQAAASLREHGFAFFFAPHYHPAFKHIAPARKICAGRGQRTVFNYLGPLLNPARPSAQLMGVPRPELCDSLAKVLKSIGIRRGMVVCGKVPRPDGDAFLDELSTLGETTVAEFYQDRGFSVSVMSPGDFPVQKATLADLEGGDAATNAELIRGILKGADRGPRRDAVLLNAGAALFLANRARSISEGWEVAAQTIDSGAARAKLEALRR